MNLLSAHLTRLADFSGRENRQPFWLWVLVTYGAQMALSFALMIPMMVSMGNRMAALQQYDQTYLDAHPEVASRVMTQTMLPFFRYLLLFMVVVIVVHAVLLAAAVVRRLHDTDRSGYWALPYVLAQLATMAGYAIVFPRFFGSIAALGQQPDPAAVNATFATIMPVFALTWLTSMVGFVFMVILIVFLASRGTIGPNRYGDDLLPPPMWPQPQQWAPQPQQWAPPQPQQWQPPQPPAPPPPARIVGPWDEPPR